MAKRDYKINEAIQLRYLSPGAQAGLTGVVAEIFDPSGTLVATIPLTEAEAGLYISNAWTPDAAGDWRARMHKADGTGVAYEAYSVGSANVDSVGLAVAEANARLASVENKVDALITAINVIGAKVDELLSRSVDPDGF